MCLQDTKLQSFIYVFIYLSTKFYKLFFSKTPVQSNDNNICIVRIFTEKIIHAVCFFSIYLCFTVKILLFFFSRKNKTMTTEYHFHQINKLLYYDSNLTSLLMCLTFGGLSVQLSVFPPKCGCNVGTLPKTVTVYVSSLIR